MDEQYHHSLHMYGNADSEEGSNEKERGLGYEHMNINVWNIDPS